MSKTFTYFKKTGEIYGRDGEWDGDEGLDFEYEVEDEDLLEGIAYCVFNEYFRNKSELSLEVGFCSAVKQGIYEFLKDFDDTKFLEDKYEDELKEYFEDKALDYYKNNY